MHGRSTTHVWPYWNVNTGHRCEVTSGSTRIIFGAGSGCYASAAEAEAAGSQVHVTVTIDGAQTVPIDGVTGVRAQPETSGCGPAFDGAQAWDVGWQSAPVTLTAGAHTFYFEETSSFRPTLSLTCAYTAR